MNYYQENVHNIPYPESDGISQRHKTICNYLFMFVPGNQRDWNKLITPQLLGLSKLGTPLNWIYAFAAGYGYRNITSQ